MSGGCISAKLTFIGFLFPDVDVVLAVGCGRFSFFPYKGVLYSLDGVSLGLFSLATPSGAAVIFFSTAATGIPGLLCFDMACCG